MIMCQSNPRKQYPNPHTQPLDLVWTWPTISQVLALPHSSCLPAWFGSLFSWQHSLSTQPSRYVLHTLCLQGMCCTHCLQGAFLLLSQVWEFLRPGAPLVTDITFIILTIVYNLMAHTVVVSSIVTFNFFPVPAAVLSVEQVSRYPQSSLSETSVCPVCPVCLSFQ